MLDNIRLGSGKDKPKKVINVNVTKKHIIIFLFCLLSFVTLIMILLSKILATDLHFSCNDGTVEQIEYQKEIYCNTHYSEVMMYFSDEQQQEISNLILYNVTK